jgi:hypothetical protein
LFGRRKHSGPSDVQALTDKLATTNADTATKTVKLDSAQSELKKAEIERDIPKKERDKLWDELRQAKDAHEAIRKQHTALNSRVRHALRIQGAIWAQPAMKGTPPFLPLSV